MIGEAAFYMHTGPERRVVSRADWGPAHEWELRTLIKNEIPFKINLGVLKSSLYTFAFFFRCKGRKRRDCEGMYERNGGNLNGNYKRKKEKNNR